MPILETFDTIVIVSEASKLRNMVSELKHPKKSSGFIQIMHDGAIFLSGVGL